MKKWKRVVLEIGTVILILIFGVYSFDTYIENGMCGNQVHNEYFSPDGSLKVIVFERDCGATTGFSTQISVTKSDDLLPNESGNVFIIAGHPLTAAPEVSWKNNSTLVILHRLNDLVFKAERSWGWFNAVTIEYQSANIHR